MTRDDFDSIRPVIDMAGRLYISLHTKLSEKASRRSTRCSPRARQT